MINFNTWYESWPLDLQISFLLAPFVIGLSGMAVLAYTTYQHYERIITAFPNSPGVQNYTRRCAGFDFHSRCMQVSFTAGFVLWPKIQIRRGELDPEEVRKFPAEIKRLMGISASLLFSGAAWLLLAVGLLKLSES
ncbi:hypothetical protein [Pseudomonas akapageensis]|uniref:hypothetical protein n=1 Tax=Pseudomonas akapageensis TaxID=2609961 RepID=UPI001407E358|nr:hypothetical protein [Pseudomonas akapageensis]